MSSRIHAKDFFFSKLTSDSLGSMWFSEERNVLLAGNYTDSKTLLTSKFFYYSS
jgi:hypothetical protein